MISSYIKIALRNFGRHKLFTLINVIGLSIGISAALVIFLIVRYDFTFNKSYPDQDRIYRVVNTVTNQNNTFHNGGVYGAMPEAVKNQVTGLSESAPFYSIDEFALNHTGAVIPGTTQKYKYTSDMILADQRYFDLFPYQWLAGTKTSLNRPFTVVLTSNKAALYFPGLPYEQVVGKTILYGDSVRTTVTGVVAEPSHNTDFTFSQFLSYSTADHVTILSQNLDKGNWGGITPASQLFVKLTDKASVGNIEKQLNDLVKKNSPAPPPGMKIGRTVSLQKLSDVHFDERYSSYGGRTADRSMLYGLLIIAAFLLLIACINFINLSTAQAVRRAKEIGIRKTLGSSRLNLLFQFLNETFLLTLFAVVLSCIAAPFLLKLFADFIPAGVKVDFLHQYDLLLFLFALTLIVSLVAGFYPAMVLSGFKPVLTLKNQVSVSTGKTRNALFRKTLTVTQFAIAQFFIMATVLVSKQVYYALHKELGFKKEAIVTVTTPWNKDPALRQVYINELAALPQVRSISMGGASPSSDDTHSDNITYLDGKKEIKVPIQERFGDGNYINVYGIRLLAGRNIGPEDIGKAFLINHSLAQSLGFSNPSDAVNKVMDYEGRPMHVAGVVADFYYRSLHSPIQPLVIVDRRDNGYFSRNLHIALKPQSDAGHDWQTALAAMQSSFSRIYPDDEFEYGFFDEAIARFYDSERRTAALLSWATGLSILISCLGLLGLAIYTTNQRTKEIGIRKVLGASVTQIVGLLSIEIVWLIGLAFLIITPVAAWAMHQWMQSFADRTSVSWWIFALSGGGMLLLALLTAGFQTIKAAKVNLVVSLKSE